MDVVRWFIDQGMDVNVKNAVRALFILFFVCLLTLTFPSQLGTPAICVGPRSPMSNIDAIEILLQHGALVDTVDHVINNLSIYVF